MLDNLDALAALARSGTMSRAATVLRISQSAVSKRIAALEEDVGTELVEPDGRRVRLTAAGHRLLGRTGPLVAELRAALELSGDVSGGSITLGVSESILAAWGPRALRGVEDDQPELELILHSHRGPVAIDHVRAGEYTLALVAGDLGDTELSADDLGEEEMILVTSGLCKMRWRRRDQLSVISIETGSATWRALERRLRRLRREAGVQISVTRRVQSFSSVVQLAAAGFGHGLVPRGIAAALGIPDTAMIRVPAPGLSRPIRLAGRKRVFARPAVERFRRALAVHVERVAPLVPS